MNCGWAVSRRRFRNSRSSSGVTAIAERPAADHNMPTMPHETAYENELVYGPADWRHGLGRDPHGLPEQSQVRSEIDPNPAHAGFLQRRSQGTMKRFQRHDAFVATKHERFFQTSPSEAERP